MQEMDKGIRNAPETGQSAQIGDAAFNGRAFADESHLAVVAAAPGTKISYSPGVTNTQELPESDSREYDRGQDSAPWSWKGAGIQASIPAGAEQVSEVDLAPEVGQSRSYSGPVASIAVGGSGQLLVKLHATSISGDSPALRAFDGQDGMVDSTDAALASRHSVGGGRSIASIPGQSIARSAA